MATGTPGQQDGEYQNWLRDNVALLFLKESIEGFTDKRVSDLHEELHRTIPQPYSRHGPAIQQHQQSPSYMQVCTTCSYNDIQRHKNTWRIRCPSKVCSTWLQYIIGYYVGATCNIARANLQPQLWPCDPWEVAKLFLPIGSENVKSAGDADVAAILKLYKTCNFMSNFINTTLVEEVLAIRHRLMHSSDLIVSDNQLQQDTDKMINLLKSLVQLSPTETQSVQTAIDNITKLQSKTMVLTHNKEVTVLHSRMQYVERVGVDLTRKYNDIDKRTQNTQLFIQIVVFCTFTCAFVFWSKNQGLQWMRRRL